MANKKVLFFSLKNNLKIIDSKRENVFNIEGKYLKIA